MVLTTFGRDSSFTASAMIFQKGASVSSGNGSLWPYLLKSCLCSACISLENLVTYLVSCCEFFDQSDSEGYEMF